MEQFQQALMIRAVGEIHLATAKKAAFEINPIQLAYIVYKLLFIS